MPDQPATLAADVPAEVLATLSAIQSAGPLPDDADPATTAAWWTARAEVAQQRADAYARLSNWAMSGGLPVAVVIAIDAATDAVRQEVAVNRLDAVRVAR